MSKNEQSAVSPGKSNKLETLLFLSTRAQEAQKTAELCFTIVNETMGLVPYRQAAFFHVNSQYKVKLALASGLVSVGENSPYTVWLNDFSKTFKGLNEIREVNLAEANSEHQDNWSEWLPEYLLIIPLKNKQDEVLGYVMYAREQGWTEIETEQLAFLNQHYSYCLNALKNANGTSVNKFFKFFTNKRLLIFAVGLIALMLVPIRLSVLAPSEVIALDAFTVASPQQGVIQKFIVEPNTVVKKGDLLFTLDNTSISNRYEVAKKSLDTAKAQALTAQQRAFYDADSRANLANAMGRVREKEAELASVASLKSRIEIRAEQDGIAIFTDSNDWIGRPVQTGERVMQIADPSAAGLLVWLPVRDAISIEVGAPIKLFLNTKPLDPIKALLKESSYQASMSPENLSSYRLKGQFEKNEELPRIGLQGTARISGDWSILGYYLFRRPIAAVREWTGI